MARYQPLSLINQLHTDMDEWFRSHWLGDGSQLGQLTRREGGGEWIPQADLYDKDTHFLVCMDLPGLERKDINISFENGVLTVSGKKEWETKKEEENCLRRERFCGSFYRSFGFPEGVDSQKIAAKIKNGVLNITIPKQSKSKTHKIEVQEEH